MTDNLSLNDAVNVTTSTPPLTGIILHIGPVSFAPGNNWVGVRLTGTSVGKGKNDGSVEGVRYFEADEKCGLFVKSSNVEKRKLSRLEELRLKREGERGAAGGASVAGKSGLSPAGRGRSTRTSIASGTTASASKKGSDGSGEEKQSHADRMEKLRARREALTKDRKSSVISTPGKSEAGSTESEAGSAKSSVASEANDDEDNDVSNRGDDKDAEEEDTSRDETRTSVNLSTATPGYRSELHRLQATITSLKTELSQKEAENASLQSSLDFMSKGAEQSTHDAVRMYAMGALALSEKKSPTPGKARSSVKRVPSGKFTEGETGGDSARNLKDELAEEGDSDEDEDDDEDDKEQVVSQAAAAVSQALVERNNELMSQLSEMASMKTNLEHELSESQERTANLTQRLQQLAEKVEKDKQSRIEEQQSFTAETSTLKSQLSSLQREYDILAERASDKSSNVSALSLAKLKAEITTLTRKNADLENEKMDMESTLEELVLDKEALKEENEMMTDQLEEMKIDLESTQYEVEDLKAQLQSGSADVEADAVDTSEDAARSLSLQNTRLRTAILRLKEQSEQEKNDLQKQLKALQTDSASKEALREELDTLKSAHEKSLSEVQELKDIVDQTTSLEETIENLSDKVWSLEQENANLERTVRELEESAEIAAEMEEVQSEELKVVMRELEGREAVVRNLEEAIRMQRRREEDFQRYVSDFRSSISTLKQEKAALLALTEGEQGEKSQLMATSQKALAQAAQLAADASAARKRDSDAVFDRIAARSATYLSRRMESLLPSGVVSAELAAVKGEIDLSRVADKAAVSLSALEDVFNRAIERGISGLSEFNVLEEGVDVVLTDGSTQQIATMVHQAEFANTVIELATDALRFMAAGQWPELLSEDLSTDLGSVVAHSISHLDLALSEQLKLLKQEGILSPLRSSLSELNQSTQSTKLALFSASDQSGKLVIPEKWSPPGLEALKSLSMGRFSCLGVTAMLASAICPVEDTDNDPPAPTLANFSSVLEKAKLSCTSVADVCKKFSGLRLNDSDTVDSLEDLAGKYQKSSSALFNYVKEAFTQKSISSAEVEQCASHLEEVATVVRQLSALLRKANLGEIDSTNFHELSPEYEDSWGGLTSVVAQVRGVDGDPEDVNYLMRARAIEQQLTDAVKNEPKLKKANTKIASLEKSLSSRSKEIAMQNSRISELESLITKSSSIMSPAKGSKAPGSPSPDTHKLKEEVRVLQEALDVMQSNAEEYEKEIKALKDKSRTPRVSRQASGRITPKRAASVADIGATLSQLGQSSASKAGAASSRDLMVESISLETALYRPALARATKSASYWKALSMGSALAQLAPLNVQIKSPEKTRCLEEVALARNELRLAKASFLTIDLSKTDVSSRSQLNAQKEKVRLAENRLHDATIALVNLQSLETGNGQSSTVEQSMNQTEMWGKIIVPCNDDAGYVMPMHVSTSELRGFHSFLVK